MHKVSNNQPDSSMSKVQERRRFLEELGSNCGGIREGLKIPVYVRKGTIRVIKNLWKVLEKKFKNEATKQQK